MRDRLTACVAVLAFGVAVVGLIGCTTEAKPLEVTYYYLPG